MRAEDSMKDELVASWEFSAEYDSICSAKVYTKGQWKVAMVGNKTIWPQKTNMMVDFQEEKVIMTEDRC